MIYSSDVAKTTSYIVVIDKIASLIPTTQSVNVPSISTGFIEFNKNKSNKFLFSSNTVNYDPILLQFIVSEDHSEYHSIYKHISESVNSDDHNNDTLIIEVQVMDNQEKRLFSYIYKGCIITNLGALRYASNEEEQNLICDLTIEIESMSIEYPDGRVLSM